MAFEINDDYTKPVPRDLPPSGLAELADDIFNDADRKAHDALNRIWEPIHEEAEAHDAVLKLHGEVRRAAERLLGGSLDPGAINGNAKKLAELYGALQGTLGAIEAEMNPEPDEAGNGDETQTSGRETSPTKDTPASAGALALGEELQSQTTPNGSGNGAPSGSQHAPPETVVELPPFDPQAQTTPNGDGYPHPTPSHQNGQGLNEPPMTPAPPSSNGAGIHQPV